MNKKTRIFAIIAIVLCIVACFAGCGNSGSNGIDQENNVEKSKLKIDDIVWSVDEGISDGERYVFLSYTNNTPYTITELEITFTEKATVSEEEKNTFLSDIQKLFEADEEEMADLRSRPVEMYASTDRIAEPGTTVSNANCYYYQGYFYVKNINHYNLVEPDIATVKYVDENTIHTAYYDLNSKKFTEDTETESAYQWSQTALSSKIPKPDAKVVKKNADDESAFHFDVCGWNREQFNAYTQACKDLGYTDESAGFEDVYYAFNAEGYKIYLSYDEDSQILSASVTAPEAEGD